MTGTSSGVHGMSQTGAGQTGVGRKAGERRESAYHAIHLKYLGRLTLFSVCAYACVTSYGSMTESGNIPNIVSIKSCDDLRTVGAPVSSSSCMSLYAITTILVLLNASEVSACLIPSKNGTYSFENHQRRILGPE